MHTYQTHSQKDADDVSLELPPDTLPLGVDEAGSTHYFSRIADTIVVVDVDGTVEQRQDIGDRPLSEWIDYVEAERGWEDLRYADSLGDLIADGLEPTP